MKNSSVNYHHPCNPRSSRPQMVNVLRNSLDGVNIPDLHCCTRFRDEPNSHSHNYVCEAHRICLSAVPFPCHGVELQNANLESALLDYPRLSGSTSVGPPKIPLMTGLNLDSSPENQRLSLVGFQGLGSLVDRLCELDKCSRSLALTLIFPWLFKIRFRLVGSHGLPYSSLAQTLKLRHGFKVESLPEVPSKPSWRCT